MFRRLQRASEELNMIGRSRHTVQSPSELLSAIQLAWVVKGPLPDHHDRLQNKLREEWPALASAIDKSCGLD